MELNEKARIISASRRCDVPAFETEWFAGCFKKGAAEFRHPYTGRMESVSLRREDVIGWVFWSRNYGPFRGILESLHEAGYRFLCQFTINGFPRSIEPRVPSVRQATELAHWLRERFGPVVTWRYDPVILTDATPPDWHRQHFEQLAESMRGVSDVCIVSVPTMYRKTLRNMGKAAERDAEARMWKPGADFSESDIRLLLADLAGMAGAHDISLKVCCGQEWVNEFEGIGSAACTDWPRLKALLAADGLPLPRRSPARRGSREGCGCYASFDIGGYNRCAHGCAYCYAVDDPEAVLRG